MLKRSFIFISLIIFLSTVGCVKETFDMNKLSHNIQFSPTLAISAVRGNISVRDMVKSEDTIVVFDQNNLVKLIFEEKSAIDLEGADFSVFTQGLGQYVASIKPDTLNLNIQDILNCITGEFNLLKPSITLNYTNSFAIPVKMKLDVTGLGKDNQSVSLDLDTFALSIPNGSTTQEISDTYIIDKDNSNLPEFISLRPGEIIFSGGVVLGPSTNGSGGNNELNDKRIIGDLKVEVPLEFRANNFQFTDTLDNFLKDSGGSNNSPVNPEDFEFLRVDINVKNGFPLGVSLKMSLYDPSTNTKKSSIDATDLLKPAPVNSSGKSSGITETTTHLDFTKQFFSSINSADNIIFQFTLNTTGNGASDISIYSDYRIDFNAALVVKPNIKFK
jgi:hypothetical protein